MLWKIHEQLSKTKMEMFGQRYEHRSGGNEGNGTNGLHLSRPLSKYKRDDQTLGSEVATLYSETEVIEEGGEGGE